MSEQTLKKYKAAVRARKNAADWNALPNGPKYQADSFSISISHCKAPMLCRAGQQTHSGRNYWETEKEFNRAILEHVVENWEIIYPDVIARLKTKENEALRNCQSFIDSMQEAIDAAQQQEGER